jgi:hypothetical protein
MTPLIVKMTGVRMVVISSQPKKQSFIDALIKGPIAYKVHPAFTEPISMAPVRGNKVLVKGDSRVYRIHPNPMPGIGAAVITDVRKNLKINVN